jgi:hypothetical protein
MRWIFATLSITTLASSFAPAAPLTIKPVLVLTGTDSAQTKQSFARCTSEKQLKKCWQMYLGSDEKDLTRPCPEVDFESYMVIVIFSGEGKKQNSGVHIVDVGDEEKCIRVRYRPSYYQSAGVPRSEGERHPLPTRSYAFVVIPMSKKQVTIEEDVSYGYQVEPEWIERAKIAAITKK